MWLQSYCIDFYFLFSDDASPNECGLEIVGIEEQDKGTWECEVGSLVGDTFETSTANIELEVKGKEIVQCQCLDDPH